MVGVLLLPPAPPAPLGLGGAGAQGLAVVIDSGGAPNTKRRVGFGEVALEWILSKPTSSNLGDEEEVVF